MSDTFEKILDLIRRDEVVISAHGHDEMAQDDIMTDDVLNGVGSALIIEEYPEYSKGLC